MKITQNHAANCFVILSVLTGLPGFGFLALIIAFGVFRWNDDLSGALSCSAMCFLSVACAWAARSLRKNATRAGLIATVVWAVMGIVTVCLLVSVISVRDPFNDLVALVFLVTESVIAIHLRHRRYEIAT
jgi:hypothetical protein